MFTYESYRERGGDKKGNFLPEDSKIEDYWVKENILARRGALTLSDLFLRVEMINVEESEQDISCDSKFMLGIIDDLENST